MRILLTGGTGYIGSHTALAVIAAGHEPILFDNFSNSVPEVAERLGEIVGRGLTKVSGDVRDLALVRSVLAHQRIDAVIHFAALKAVAESIADPERYHANNVGGTRVLIDAMAAEGVRTIVFSSSATVYGEPQHLPIDEVHPTGPINPYGQTKLACETMLSDLVSGDSGWRVSLLRYFNPVGAHTSGKIGEDPLGIPNNLMPLVTRVALGQMDRLQIYGSDYPTADGTAVRDYIHVMDLAEGHVAALEGLSDGNAIQLYNLGTGRGTSVMELVRTFEQVNGAAVPYVMTERRAGDVAEMFADAGKAERELGWRARRGLEEMCADSWRFATQRN